MSEQRRRDYQRAHQVISLEAARAEAPLRHIARIVEDEVPSSLYYVDRIKHRLGRIYEQLDRIERRWTTATKPEQAAAGVETAHRTGNPPALLLGATCGSAGQAARGRLLFVQSGRVPGASRDPRFPASANLAG